jgi:hypothetical protein
MSIKDYTYVATVGFNCMPTHQLARAAKRFALAPSRVNGPFDWFMLTIDHVVTTLESDFRQFFRPETVQITGKLDEEHWRVMDRTGIKSWHHFGRKSQDENITAHAWSRFERWMSRRRKLWQSALADPNGRVLFIRVPNAAQPDTVEELIQLAQVLRERASGEISVAALTFVRLHISHPHVRTYPLKRTWPEHLDVDQMDWDRDYGLGPAWQGHDASWDELWDRV